MQFNDIERRVLNYLERQFVAGGGFATVTADDMMRENGLHPDQFTRLLARFETLGILEEVTLDGMIEIKGAVCHFAAELNHVAPPSGNLTSTVNVLNIGQVSHSLIQQGTVGSTQKGSSENGAGGERTDQAAPYNLTLDARALLIEASKDANGKVTCNSTMRGHSIQTNGREFLEQQDPRSVAKWTQALNDLAACGLLEDRWHHGEVFVVTSKGYETADASRE